MHTRGLCPKEVAGKNKRLEERDLILRIRDEGGARYGEKVPLLRQTVMRKKGGIKGT